MSDENKRSKELPCGHTQGEHDAAALARELLAMNNMAALAVKNLLVAEVQNGDLTAAKELDALGEVIRQADPDQLAEMARDGHMGAAACLSIGCHTAIEPAEARILRRRENGARMHTFTDDEGNSYLVAARGVPEGVSLKEFVQNALKEVSESVESTDNQNASGSPFGFNFGSF